MGGSVATLFPGRERSKQILAPLAVRAEEPERTRARQRAMRSTSCWAARSGGRPPSVLRGHRRTRAAGLATTGLRPVLLAAPEETHHSGTRGRRSRAPDCSTTCRNAAV
jgi:hypothetical protein